MKGGKIRRAEKEGGEDGKREGKTDGDEKRDV